MPRKVTVAAIQMEGTPSPVEDRLPRAARHIEEAAATGAKLIVLPEVFNTGYEVNDHNYTLPEQLDGQTASWMHTQATKYNVHIAGSFMVREEEGVYNTMLLVAPDGRKWRYDKHHPWAFERAYVLNGNGITVADTDIGRIGMLICWDYAHMDLWEQYSGQVDMMIISSCPIGALELDIVLPGGKRINTSNAPHVKVNYRGADVPFGKDIDALAHWMRVPVINAGHAGVFRTKLPLSGVSMSVLLAHRPLDLMRHLKDSHKVMLEAPYYRQTKIVRQDGLVMKRAQHDTDGLIMSEITLANRSPKPFGSPPQSAFTPLAYFTLDWLIGAISTPMYHIGHQILPEFLTFG